jgi:3-phytase
MKPIDNGGLPMFEGQTGEGERDLMGIALYTDPKGNIYAITGRKTGPKDGTIFGSICYQIPEKDL